MNLNINNIQISLLTKLFVAFSIILTFSFILIPHISKAQTTEQQQAVAELQKKINERNANIQKLNEEIAQYQALADKTSTEALTLQRAIKTLESNGKALDLDIKKTRTQIEATNLDIEKLDIVIDESKDKIEMYKETIARNLNEAYRKEDTSIVSTFLSQKSLSGLLNEIDNLYQFNNTLQNVTAQLAAERVKYEGNKKEEVKQKDELVKLQTELADKKKVVEYNKSEQNKVLKETKNNEKTYQQIVQDKLALKTAFEKDVFEYENQIKYTFDPSSVPKVGSSPLGWPVANVTITQMFGKTSASKRLYVSGSHNGVDFGARTGTPVLALADGVVDGAGDTDITCPKASFGRWVLIKYNNGLASTYGHLSVIKAVKGQTVKTGDVIGYSGSTGYSTGPHVHISLYAANAVTVQSLPSKSCSGRTYTMPIAATDGYLDPMLYFPPYKK